MFDYRNGAVTKTIKNMKLTEMTFAEGFLGLYSNNDNPHRAFDWDKAAEIIKEQYKLYPDLIAEAGLQRDWRYTAGVIFENGKPTNESYTYLASNWATPTLILTVDGDEILEIECSIIQDGSRFNSKSSWDEQSLRVLGIPLEE